MVQRVQKSPWYRNVEIRMTKREFLDWATPLYEKWQREHPGVRASVDRIDSTGHYEIGNIQLISQRHNMMKAMSETLARETSAPKYEAGLSACLLFL